MWTKKEISYHEHSERSPSNCRRVGVGIATNQNTSLWKRKGNRPNGKNLGRKIATSFSSNRKTETNSKIVSKNSHSKIKKKKQYVFHYCKINEGWILIAIFRLRYINAESMNMKKQHNAMVDGYDEIDQIFEAIDEKLKVLETKVVIFCLF